ncbi:hypothetical protein KOI40_14500 [Aestuariicella sp. G3-2]|uniref:hypothetical protein n=1 Tax=Pseudomaricurvus albidus TaxID=2842452 RepID=UPI001C0BB138|nr:hypothetical protein [Aestuariicella albida]MBU3071031.1 hypothetical protein [Aestuariicella albida]
MKIFKPESGVSKILQLVHAFMCLKNDSSLKSIPKCDILIICHEGDRAALKQGLRYSQLSDSLGDYLEAKGAAIGSVTIGLAGCSPNQLYRKPLALNRYMIFYSMLRSFGFKNCAHNFLARVFEKIIHYSECKTIITQQSWRGVVYAASKSNIPIYLLIHGIGYPEPDRGHKGEDPFAFPDFYLSLDEITTNSLSTLVPLQRIVQTAHPWLRQFESVKDTDCSDWRLKSSLIEGIESYKKVTLLTLQYGYDGEFPVFEGIIPNGIVHEEVVSAIVETEKEVAWLVRLHPRQQAKRQYEKHRDFVSSMEERYPNVFFSGLSQAPLPALLRVVDNHVTMISMSCYEAAWCNVPSLVLCPTTFPGKKHEKYFSDLEGVGAVVKGNLEAKEIAQWVKSSSKMSDGFIGVRYQEDESIEHILRSAKIC